MRAGPHKRSRHHPPSPIGPSGACGLFSTNHETDQLGSERSQDPPDVCPIRVGAAAFLNTATARPLLSGSLILSIHQARVCKGFLGQFCSSCLKPAVISGSALHGLSPKFATFTSCDVSSAISPRNRHHLSIHTGVTRPELSAPQNGDPAKEGPHSPHQERPRLGPLLSGQLGLLVCALTSSQGRHLLTKLESPPRWTTNFPCLGMGWRRIGI